jgi:CSLREA domain-containing protein
MRRIATTLLLVTSVIGSEAAVPPATFAATITVNTTTDAVDINPGNGVCATAAGNCSLRAAVMEANALPGSQSINLPQATYALTISGTDEDSAGTGDLDINDDLTIDGFSRLGGSPPVVDAQGLDRAFDIVRKVPKRSKNDKVAVPKVTITNVVIRNGGSGRGGAIQNWGDLRLRDMTLALNNAGIGVGGAISNRDEFSSVHLERVLLQQNHAGTGGAIHTNEGPITGSEVRFLNNSATMWGGALATDEGEGSVELQRSSFEHNTAQVSGGAIFYHTGANPMRLVNVTFSHNTASGSADVQNVGGGAIYASVSGSAVLRLDSVTFSHNSAFAGAAIFKAPKPGSEGPVFLNNTIIANSQGPSCSGEISSTGHNLDDGATCGLTALTDLPNTAADLEPLADNGGFTRTHALRRLPISSAVDTGDSRDCPKTDQRGRPRPADGDGIGHKICDRGAYELAPPGIRESISPFVPILDLARLERSAHFSH